MPFGDTVLRILFFYSLWFRDLDFFLRRCGLRSGAHLLKFFLGQCQLPRPVDVAISLVDNNVRSKAVLNWDCLALVVTIRVSQLR